MLILIFHYNNGCFSISCMLNDPVLKGTSCSWHIHGKIPKGNRTILDAFFNGLGF